MSIVEYHYHDHKPAPDPSQTTTSSHKQKLADPAYPTFVAYAQLHAWAWGLSGRTSKVGLVITFAGYMCVDASLKLGIGHARQEHSPVLLESSGANSGTEEREMATLRHRLLEDQSGRAKFMP